MRVRFLLFSDHKILQYLFMQRDVNMSRGDGWSSQKTIIFRSNTTRERKMLLQMHLVVGQYLRGLLYRRNMVGNCQIFRAIGGVCRGI